MFVRIIYSGAPTWTRTRNIGLEDLGYIPLTMGTKMEEGVGFEPTTVFKTDRISHSRNPPYKSGAG